MNGAIADLSDKISSADLIVNRKKVNGNGLEQVPGQFVYKIPKQNEYIRRCLMQLIRSYSVFKKDRIFTSIEIKDIFYKLPANSDQYEINLNFL